MGTRGFLGFVVNGDAKIAYNHSDSYPEGLGLDVLRWLREHAMPALGAVTEAAEGLHVVGDVDPTDEQIAELVRWTDTGFGGHSERPEWYQLLHRTQGDPAQMLAAGYIEDASEFPLDSLFAEWGYIVDLDRHAFEVYQGFQKAPHARGRFAAKPEREGYYPCALLVSWSLDALPTDAEFEAACEEAEN